MAKPKQSDVVNALLAEHGETYAEELGIKLKRGSATELFKWLVASILLSARIRSTTAVQAAGALFGEGWTTPKKLRDAGWSARTKTLNRAGYARYDERTSAMLGESCEMLLDRYRGDVRKLREQADRDPKRERTLLKQLKGLGDVGVDIFFREVQVVWPELAPFVDKRALEPAGKLGLPTDPKRLAKLVSPKELPRLVAALTRVRLEDGYDAVRERAGARPAA